MDAHSKIIPFHLHPLGFVDAFTHLGANFDALVRDTGITRAMLEAKDAKISYFQQSMLIRNGVDLCQRPGIGLLLGLHFDWLFYGTVGGVIHCSPTLRQAGEAFRRYLMIAQPYYAIYGPKPTSYMDENGMIIDPLRCFPAERIGPTMAQFELEFRLATQLRVWDACGNKSVSQPDVHVALAIPEPAHVTLYRQLPCSTIRFGMPQSYISAHRDFLCTPFRECRRGAFRRILDRCEQELHEAQVEPSWTAKVRWHVYAQFGKPVPIERVAELLGITERALARKLAAESTNFRDVVHEVRMEIATHHLRSSKLSVDEVADLLGFSSASSLRRAIKNWSGDVVSNVRPGKPAGYSRRNVGSMAAVGA